MPPRPNGIAVLRRSLNAAHPPAVPLPGHTARRERCCRRLTPCRVHSPIAKTPALCKGCSTHFGVTMGVQLYLSAGARLGLAGLDRYQLPRPRIDADGARGRRPAAQVRRIAQHHPRQPPRRFRLRGARPRGHPPCSRWSANVGWFDDHLQVLARHHHRAGPGAVEALEHDGQVALQRLSAPSGGSAANALCTGPYQVRKTSMKCAAER